ncbi:helix-turn-helix domain-containing protein [Tepidibacillus marianensis]|uniref:helix-turn-helix domain-containing protein n=1 Tax=Tepidibacillus marianensis TaxID=3131995 RepID=UPI0030D3FC20
MMGYRDLALFDMILFQLVNHMKGDRSKTGIIRILKGSLAKQTLQDIHFYHIEPYYGQFSMIDESEINDRIGHFIQEGYFRINDKWLVLEQKGIDYLKRIIEKNRGKTWIFHTNLVIHKNRKEQFWKRLVLVIQSLSYLSHQNNRFIPAVPDMEIKEWVKGYLKPQQKQRLLKITKQLHQELNWIKDNIEPIDQQILLLRMHGEHRSALTWRQLESSLEMSIIEVKLRFSLILYTLFFTVCKEKEKYPILTALFSLDNHITTLSKSTQYTSQLLKRGMALEQIAHKRGLTIGTIYDHIVEIILEIPLSIHLNNYIEEWKIDEIKKWYKQMNSYRLSDYKELLDERITYQDLRLVLSYYHVNESDSLC